MIATHPNLPKRDILNCSNNADPGVGGNFDAIPNYAKE